MTKRPLANICVKFHQLRVSDQKVRKNCSDVRSLAIDGLIVSGHDKGTPYQQIGKVSAPEHIRIITLKHLRR